MKPLGLLVISKEAWSDVRWARKQWLPYYLAQHNEIDRVIYADRHRAWWRRENSQKQLHEGNIEIRQEMLLLPFERWATIRAFNRRRIASHLANDMDSQHDWVTLIYHPYDVPMMRALAEKSVVVFDWTEDWAVFHQDSLLANLQRQAILQADAVFTVTESLYDKAVEWRGSDAHVFLIPNATALEAVQTLAPEPECIRNIPRPRIGFVGHAGPWFDVELVVELVRRQPAWHWLMIGGWRDDARRMLDECASVHWLGSHRPKELLPYMQHCDVLIAPYRNGIQGDATKLYDYLAAGRPIISIPCETAQRLQPWVRMCHGADDWESAITGILAGTQDVQKAPDSVIAEHHWRFRAESVGKIFRSLIDG